MRPFEGFQRRAVVIVPTDEEFLRRCEQREKVEGKEIPDSAVLEMKGRIQQQARFTTDVSINCRRKNCTCVTAVLGGHRSAVLARSRFYSQLCSGSMLVVGFGPRYCLGPLTVVCFSFGSARYVTTWCSPLLQLDSINHRIMISARC